MAEPASAPTPANQPSTPANAPSPAPASGAGKPPAKKPEWLADDGIDLDLPTGKTRLSWDKARAQLQKGAHGDRLLFEANKTREEAQRLKAEADDALADLKDPAKVLKRLASMGHDIRRLTAGHVISEVEREEMSPAEREALELREKLANIEAEKKTAEAAKAKEAEEAQARAAIEEYKAKWTSMAEQLGMKPGPHMAAFFQRIAGMEARNLAAGINAPAEVLIDAVRADSWALAASTIEATPDAELFDRLGEETVKRIAAAFLAHKRPTAPQGGDAGTAATPEISRPVAKPRASNGQYAPPSTREGALFDSM